MNTELQGLLCHLTDEDFNELAINVDISTRIKDLMVGENGFEQAEILERFDFTPNDMIYVVNGAFDFTTRHMAILKVLEEEKAFFDETYDDEEENQSTDNAFEEMLSGENDVPDVLNYDIHDREPNESTIFEDDKAHISGSNSMLTAEEEWELEHGKSYTAALRDTRPPVYSSKATTNPFEDEMNRVFKEHQEKLSNEQSKETPKSGNDNSLIEFMDM